MSAGADHCHCWHGAGRAEDHPNYALGCCHCGQTRYWLTRQYVEGVLAAQALPWITAGEPSHGPYYPTNVLFPAVTR